MPTSYGLSYCTHSLPRSNSVFQNSQLTVAGHGPHRTGGRGRWIPKRNQRETESLTAETMACSGVIARPSAHAVVKASSPSAAHRSATARS